jgi:hypothetical protein
MSDERHDAEGMLHEHRTRRRGLVAAAIGTAAAVALDRSGTARAQEVPPPPPPHPPPPPSLPPGVIRLSTLLLPPSPERFVDTRSALGGVQGVVAAGSTSTFTMTGRLGSSGRPELQIPDDAVGLVGNLTVIGAPGTPGAYLTMWPGGEMPTVSNLNFGPDSVGNAIANSFIVGLADTTDGHRCLRVFNSGQCDYIIDVTGYYL